MAKRTIKTKVKGIHGVNKKAEFEVINTIKNIEKINGKIRTVTIELMSNGGKENEDPSIYGSKLDNGTFPSRNGVKGKDYSFSHVAMNKKQFMEDDVIKQSISTIMKGKPRSQDELDKISVRMAKLAARNVIDYIQEGSHRHYQHWKETNEENLFETGDLLDSIRGVAKRNGTIIGGGR